MLLNHQKIQLFSNIAHLHRKRTVYLPKIIMAHHQNCTLSCTLIFTQKYQLKEKDILKLGKQKIKVR
jgi:hypothetical protein